LWVGDDVANPDLRKLGSPAHKKFSARGGEFVHHEAVGRVYKLTRMTIGK
jgi:hypothetical protein